MRHKNLLPLIILSNFTIVYMRNIIIFIMKPVMWAYISNVGLVSNELYGTYWLS